ncbi:MAG TPA: hypothetical protein VI488_08190 [Candidatus Angelobacter sp.]
MKTYWILILLGIILFAVSFRLIAVREAGASPSDSGIRGYTCAYTTLLAPWGGDGLRMLREGPVEYLAILLSGWINPVFLITLVVVLVRPNGRLAGILRVVLVIMFLACWVVFYKEHLHPREGYFLWTGAMLLVLFSNQLSKPQPEMSARSGKSS